jgi:hypothetical protein
MLNHNSLYINVLSKITLIYFKCFCTFHFSGEMSQFYGEYLNIKFISTFKCLALHYRRFLLASLLNHPGSWNVFKCGEEFSRYEFPNYAAQVTILISETWHRASWVRRFDIWKVHGSNLGWNIFIPTAFCGFPGSLKASLGIIPRLGHNRLPPHPFQFITVSFAKH